MQIKYALKILIFSLLVVVGVCSQAWAETGVENPVVKLADGTVKLCTSPTADGQECSALDIKSSIHPTTKIISLPSAEGAPYVWLALGSKFSSVCAAGEHFTNQNMCVRIGINMLGISISRVSSNGVAFTFSAKDHKLSIDELQKKSTRFVKSYSDAINILHAYAQGNWTANAPGVIAQVKAKSTAANSVVAPDGEPECGERVNTDSPLLSSPPKVLSCGDGGGGDEGGGGIGGGGGESGGGIGGGDVGGGGACSSCTGYEEPNPYPDDIDPETGQPVPKVIIRAPAPVWPTDPSWCSLVGLYCSAPAAASGDDVEHAAYCVAQELAAYNYCMNIYVTDPNHLPGSGYDMIGRFRMCVRAWLDSAGCYNY